MTTEGHNESSERVDRFERVRETLWGTPGFQRRNSTIVASGFTFFPQASWIVETIHTDDNITILLQLIDKEGGQRIVIPRKVCEAIYKHHESIMAKRRQKRAQHGAETRKAKQS